MNVSREVDSYYDRMWEDMERRRMQEEEVEEYQQKKKEEENEKKIAARTQEPGNETRKPSRMEPSEQKS